MAGTFKFYNTSIVASKGVTTTGEENTQELETWINHHVASGWGPPTFFY